LQDALASLNLLRDTDTPYLDIIAIHGILEADPTKTWSTPLTQTPSSTGAVNWLVDDNMLPSQITNLRIWSFQYSTTPLSVREGGLKAHMDSTAIALRRLMHQKILDNSTQSILFIAQGYGGLLALKAVLEHGLGARTIGIVCLGTAFRPVEIENSIADTLPIPGHSSAANSIALSEEFNALPELLSDFRAARGTFLIPIRCFYETEPVRGRSSSRFIVPKQAAVLDDINAISFALDDVDHFTMSKYSGPEDHNYELMCDVLKGLVDNAYPAMLTQATINGDVAYARSIVENHGPSFATNDALNAALKAAVTNGQDRILQMILDANIRVNAPLTAERDTALILAVQSTVPTKLVIVRKLLQKGADVAMLNEDDKSAIQYAVELHDHELEQLLRNRPLIVGPPVRRESYDWIKNPVLSFNDWGSSDGLFAKVADVYEVHGEERTFLRTPSVHDLIYRHGPRHLMNRERSKETEEGVKKFRWLHLPANNVRGLICRITSCLIRCQMLWMKDLIQRNYREQIPSENLSKDYYLYKCSSILDKSHWEDLITSSPLPELSHIRHLNPRCRTMPCKWIILTCEINSSSTN
jgi:pimeloyl-ACP methyl ester carboxylesterase